MWSKVFGFSTIFFTALALSGAMAHLYELPNKINFTANDYLTVQQIYRGWSLLGIAVFGALASTLALAILVRKQGTVFKMVLLALLCIIATQIIFWIFTYPVNQQTKNWTTLPSNWLELRSRWEYSHAAGAILNLAALSALTLSVLVKGKR
jgi:hypothetical protein